MWGDYSIIIRGNVVVVWFEVLYALYLSNSPLQSIGDVAWHDNMI